MIFRLRNFRLIVLSFPVMALNKLTEQLSMFSIFFQIFINKHANNTLNASSIYADKNQTKTVETNTFANMWRGCYINYNYDYTPVYSTYLNHLSPYPAEMLIHIMSFTFHNAHVNIT